MEPLDDPTGPSVPATLWRSLIEDLPLVTYLAADGDVARLLYLSPQVVTLLGRRPEEFVADDRLWLACVHAEDRADVAGRPVGEREYRMVAADGSVRRVWERTTLLPARDGAPAYLHGVVVDVTVLREAEEALRDARDRAERYLDITAAAILVLEADGTVALLNRAGHELLGLGSTDVLGRDWFDLAVPEDDRARQRRNFEWMVSGRIPPVAYAETAIVRADGQRRAVGWHNAVVRDGDGTMTAMLCSGVDVTERRAAEEEIAFLAYHDPLTRLPNRARLDEDLDGALARARRHGRAVALLYLDLDNFKLVNDSLGHAAGDRLLGQVAERLSGRRRDGDLLARHGGDEFLLLLPDLERGSAAADAAAAGAGMIEALEAPFRLGGAEFHVGMSVGISVFPDDAADGPALQRHADAAMYDAKRAGRGQMRIFDEDGRRPVDRLALTTRLRTAFERDEIVVHYQPIVDPASGAVAALEALVRWEHPERGLVGPAEFVPLAEETGLIDRLGARVLDLVCRERRAWHEAGLDPVVTVNVSARELRQPDFADRVAATLDAHGVPGAGLVLEVTERVAMQDPARIGPVLAALSGLGIDLALDDLGAGYSSLERLRRLPVRTVKVGHGIVGDAETDAVAEAILAAVVHLARSLGLRMVAEGVETAAQRALVVELGCPYAQGFFFARPQPATAITPLLHGGRG